jgi:hypothetical protein
MIPEKATLLVRPTGKTPARDRFLLLKGPAGEVTGGFHHGDRLDAAKAQRLLQAHGWEEVESTRGAVKRRRS